MNDVFTAICLAGFAVLPSGVLGLRFKRPEGMPWWVAIFLVVVLGLALILVAAMLRETPESGAGKVCALFFGWAFALVWSIPWFLVYGAVQLLRRPRASRSALPDVSPQAPPRAAIT